jgi:hypothetical protein
LAEDPRLEAGARARCAFYGLNPDEPAREKGSLIPLWKTFVAEVRAVIEAADAVDRVAALKSGATDPGGLIQKVWLAMSVLRGT